MILLLSAFRAPAQTAVPPTYQRRRDGGSDKRREEDKEVQEQGSIIMDEVTMETDQFRPRRSTRNRKCNTKENLRTTLRNRF